MPDNPVDNDGTMETGEGRLPAPTRAPEQALTRAAAQQPALSDEELRKRQEALGTKRKPAGPPLERAGRGRRAATEAVEQPADVPETDVTPEQTGGEDE